MVNVNSVNQIDFHWWKAENYTFQEEVLESNEEEGKWGFIAPREDPRPDNKHTTLTKEELLEPDEGAPVHKELLQLDPMDLNECYEFISKWGHLGTVFRWERLRQSGNSAGGLAMGKEGFQTFADLEVLPLEWEPNTVISEFISGEEYFSPFVTKKPSEISYLGNYMSAYWPPSETSIDVVNLQIMPYYGEWVFTKRDRNANTLTLQNWARLNYPNIHAFMLSFTMAAWRLQVPFDWEKKDFIYTDVQDRSLQHIEPYLQVLPGGRTNLQFRPRTLLDFCKLMIAIEDINSCLNCNEVITGRFCDKSCKNSFYSRRNNQAKNFLDWSEQKQPTLPQSWPRNAKGNPFHPVELLERNPLEKDQPRPLKPEEKELIVQWAKHYRDTVARKSKKRGNYDFWINELLKGSS